MLEGIFAIAGFLIGSFIPIYIHKQDRKDKYRFIMIKDKFQVYQQAYNHSGTMIGVLTSIILKEEHHIIEVFREIEDWFDKHLLYLEPGIRSDFKNTIKFVNMYRLKLDMMTKAREDDDMKADKIYSEIEIMRDSINELPARIEACMNKYYK